MAGQDDSGSKREDELRAAIRAEDPGRAASLSSKEELERLILAEDLVDRRHRRHQRRSRWVSLTQMAVGYVALAGFFVNALQIWSNRHEAEQRAQVESDRWSKEFKRSQDADKYRAFFDTSALASDPDNADKRLVGYALLKEFVADKDYNGKATVLLQESLAQELRRPSVAPGLDEQHNAAVVAIIAALSSTNDCRALANVAGSVDILSQRHGSAARRPEDLEEPFHIYVRWLLGPSLKACPTAASLRAVRAPLRDFLMKTPAIADAKKLTVAEANRAIADILSDHCDDDVECPGIKQAYLSLCSGALAKDPDEAAACELMRAAPK